MVAVGVRVGVTVGTRVGVTQGRASSGLAQYLPSIYGIYPIWHHASTTPNADGAISAIADVSLGLYPLSQGTPANQPSRGSGKITFDGGDWMETADATLSGFATGSAYTLLLVIECDSATPAAVQEFAGWGHTSSAARYGYIAHRTDDEMTALQRHGGTAQSVIGTTNLDSTRITLVGVFTNGASGNIALYRQNALENTSATSDPGSTVSDRFSLGGVYLGAAPATGLNGALVAACAVSVAADATMRGQWQAWADAGCPL